MGFIIVVMGVSGVGKSTVGLRLAQRLGWRFVEGDVFHSAANIAKMHAGEGLSDVDREPWISALIDYLNLDSASHYVVACSALTVKIRARLVRETSAPCRFIYLRGDADLVRTRLETRVDHFAAPAILTGQYAALEEPDDALILDARASPDVLVDTVIEALGLENTDGHND